MPPDIETPVVESQPVTKELHHYTCERCGFEYDKEFDYEPYLCYRCIRFIAKKTYTVMHTIQPRTSVPDKGDI